MVNEWIVSGNGGRLGCLCEKRKEEIEEKGKLILYYKYKIGSD